VEAAVSAAALAEAGEATRKAGAVVVAAAARVSEVKVVAARSEA